MASAVRGELPFRRRTRRLVLVRHQDRTFLLQSAFDEELDEYSDLYAVYAVPASVVIADEPSSWRFLENAALDHIGEIPVSDVRFDESKTKMLDPSVIDRLL